MSSIILEVADIVGDALADTFLDAVLTREIPGNGPACDPGEPTLVTYGCKALVDNYGAFTRGQGLVAGTELKVMVLASSLTVQPQPLDKIEIAQQGFVGRIVAADTAGNPPVETDPARAVWICRAST